MKSSRGLLFLLLTLVTLFGQPLTAQQDALQAERTRLDLMAEKTFFLVQRYLANARGLEDALDFEGAERELLKARELDPTNPVVTDYLRQVQALLGRPGAQGAALRMSAAERYEAQRQQMRYQARSDLASAEAAIANGQYDQALTLARSVSQRIQWTRAEIDWAEIEPRAQSLLNQAESLADGERDGVARQRQEEAYRRLQQEELRLDDQRSSRLDRLLVSGFERFQRDDYEGAAQMAQSVLDEDPHNERAFELLSAAEQGAREYADRNFVRERKEQFARWAQGMEAVRIPYADTFTGPDRDHWEKITRDRAGTGGRYIATPDPEADALRKSLGSTRMDVNFVDMTMTQVANNIFFTSGIPISVDPEVGTDLDDAGEVVNLTGLRNLTVEAVLNILVDQVGDDLAWTVRNGRVYLTYADKAQGDPIVRIHNIQDLTFPLTDFKGSSIRDIYLPGESGDDTETTVFNSELDRVQLIPPEEILNLVRENIARESWDLSDAYNIDFLDNNNLLVVHTPEVQQQVAAFLDDLRQFSTSMVTLETHFFAITDAFIEEIGTDIRGLGPNGNLGETTVLDSISPDNTQGLDNSGDGTQNPNAGFVYEKGSGNFAASVENFFSNPLSTLLSTVGGGSFQFTILKAADWNVVMRMIEKSVHAMEVTAPIVSVFNTQRAFVTVVNQVTYVQGYDVDVANAARIADPLIGIIQEGIVLDVRPTISFDRKYVTLDVQTTVAELTRPIRRFQTNLGGNTEPVEFQLPELNVQDAQTTVVVPDGGSVILGGFKKVFYKNRTADTPWLSQIPVIGYWFREKGLADEMEDLIIVIKCTISDYSKLQDQPVTAASR